MEVFFLYKEILSSYINISLLVYIAHEWSNIFTLRKLSNNLYVRIERCRRNDNFREDVLLSCFALRGSYDPTYGYYAVDLYSSNERIYNYRIAVLNLIGDRNINPERGNRNKQLRIRLDDFTSEMQSMEHWNMYKYSKHPDGLSIQN